MDFITLNEENLESEHICCSISPKKGENGVELKKAWLKDRIAEGLVFTKLNERGKVFIEYLPAEQAFAPIEAKNYMYINCFWVSGKFKGQGYANKLLDKCIEDAKSKNKDGLVILSSKKKKPFLSDPKFLKYKGFEVCDVAEPYYELLYLPFNLQAVPKFNSQAKSGSLGSKKNVLYYTNQCPHTEKYVLLVKNIADENNVDLEIKKLISAEESKLSPCPFTTYSLYLNGEFITNEILTEKKFLEILISNGILKPQ